MIAAASPGARDSEMSSRTGSGPRGVSYCLLRCESRSTVSSEGLAPLGLPHTLSSAFAKAPADKRDLFQVDALALGAVARSAKAARTARSHRGQTVRTCDAGHWVKTRPW